MASKNKNHSHKRKKRTHFKDIVIYFFLCLILIIFIINPEFYGKPMAEWSDNMMHIVGDLSIYLLGIIGLFEFCYDNGLLFLVPHNFAVYKEKHLEKQTKDYIYTFLDKETEFLHEHERLRAGELMSIIGLSTHDHSLIQSRVIEARLSPMYDISTAKSKLEDILFHSDVIRDLHTDSEVSQNPDFRFYFRFSDLMHDPALRILISKITATYIYHTLGDKTQNAPYAVSNLDIVMTPTHGNFLLGFDVNAHLGKHYIKLIPKIKVRGNNYYEGIIPEKNSNDGINVLLVHDILVSGDQIGESIDQIRTVFGKCNICVFSLIYRNFSDALTKLQRTYDDVKFYNMIEYSEDDIAEKKKQLIENDKNDIR